MAKTLESLLAQQRKAQSIWAKRFGATVKEIALNPDGTMPGGLKEQTPATKVIWPEGVKPEDLKPVAAATNVATNAAPKAANSADIKNSKP